MAQQLSPDALRAARRVLFRHRPNDSDGLRCQVCGAPWRRPARGELISGCPARRLALHWLSVAGFDDTRMAQFLGLSPTRAAS
ncbi:hypothetical protein [Actinoplanes sp. URMC 104]|uniref:hypothetical protein n=1 Tax=Actinoplanes sp. URMC 104 TaxID=3423409 RepID=UPI003F1B68B2